MKTGQDCCQNLFEYAPDAILQVDNGDAIIAANPQASKLTGYGHEDLVGKPITELFAPDELIRKPLRRDLLERGEAIIKNRILLRKDGTRVPVKMNTILTPQGVVWSFIRDISKFLDERNSLKEIEKRYEVAFKTSPDSVAITDMNGRFVEVNNGFCQIFGWKVPEVLGRTSVELGFWVDIAERNNMFERIRRDGCALDFETSMRRKDGAIINILASFTTMAIDGVPHNLSVIRDITKRKSMENNLREAKRKAEESDRLKSAFLANISHEIRTPMNAILGFSSLLMDLFETDVEHREYLKIILDRGHDLVRIIDEVLEASSLAANEVKYQFTEVYLPNVITEIQTSFDHERKGKGASVKLEFAPLGDLSETVLHTDYPKLKRILSILLENGLKFTDHGEVRLSCRLPTSESIEFSVQDTGIGIPEEEQSLVFESFRRVEGDQAIVRGGAGLGLAICKAYVEGLGGTLSVESELGKGSRFTFQIPVSKPN